jgi:hypothetical protein
VQFVLGGAGGPVVPQPELAEHTCTVRHDRRVRLRVTAANHVDGDPMTLARSMVVSSPAPDADETTAAAARFVANAIAS